MAERRENDNIERELRIEKILSINEPEDHALLARETRAPEILEKLSRSDKLEVKRWVASNKYTPATVRWRFVREEGIRIINIILELYKNQPEIIKEKDIDVLNFLSKYDVPSIRVQAKEIIRNLKKNS